MEIPRVHERLADSRSAAGADLPGKDEFWHERTLAELASTQSIGPVIHLEDVLGRGESLWESDEQFDQFVGGICERRQTLSRPSRA